MRAAACRRSCVRRWTTSRCWSTTRTTRTPSCTPYRGTPLTERTGEGYAGSLPDTITIYRLPLVADFGDDPARLEDEIRVTVVHELGHHFGLDEDELERLGWG